MVSSFLFAVFIGLSHSIMSAYTEVKGLVADLLFVSSNGLCILTTMGVTTSGAGGLGVGHLQVTGVFRYGIIF